MNTSSFGRKPIGIIEQIFQNLQGKWDIQRTLGKQTTMAAIASFTPIPASLAYYYEEKGQLQLGKKCVHAYKHYIYRLQYKRIGIYNVKNAITKEQGNLLYQLNFIGTIATATYPLHAYGTHICQADTYRAYYQFLSVNAFQLTYYINGPRKDLVINTNFAKIGLK